MLPGRPRLLRLLPLLVGVGLQLLGCSTWIAMWRTDAANHRPPHTGSTNSDTAQPHCNIPMSMPMGDNHNNHNHDQQHHRDHSSGSHDPPGHRDSWHHYLRTHHNCVFHGLPEQTLLNWVNTAERNLRIYLYPFPPGSELDDGYFSSRLKMHFRIEYMFIRYLKTLFEVREKIPDSRRDMVTDDPEKANAFIISHYWRTRNGIQMSSCGYVVRNHLKSIIDNVVDGHHYFNRSLGKDHFMLGVFDKGLWDERSDCFEEYLTETAQILKRVSSVNMISNYGMDLLYFYQNHSAAILSANTNVTEHSPEVKFIAGNDIVVPQPLESAPEYSDGDHGAWFDLRKYDSSFAGSTWFDRERLFDINQTQFSDYETLRTESFLPVFSRAEAWNSPVLAKSYFGYCPCGFACWSVRLIDALSKGTVPVIVGSGPIQPFERFIDWQRLSVKVSSETWWSSDRRLTATRQQLRIEADTFRSIILQLRNHWPILINDNATNLRDFHKFLYASIFQQQLPRQMPPSLHNSLNINNYNYSHSSSNESSLMTLVGRLAATTIMQKRIAIHRVMDWLYLREYDGIAPASKFSYDPMLGTLPRVRHPYRLLLLEMYCRVTDWPTRHAAYQAYMTTNESDTSQATGTGGANVEDVCSRVAADHTARKEYVF